MPLNLRSTYSAENLSNSQMFNLTIYVRSIAYWWGNLFWNDGDLFVFVYNFSLSVFFVPFFGASLWWHGSVGNSRSLLFSYNSQFFFWLCLSTNFFCWFDLLTTYFITVLAIPLKKYLWNLLWCDLYFLSSIYLTHV